MICPRCKLRPAAEGLSRCYWCGVVPAPTPEPMTVDAIVRLAKERGVRAQETPEWAQLMEWLDSKMAAFRSTLAQGTFADPDDVAKQEPVTLESMRAAIEKVGVLGTYFWTSLPSIYAPLPVRWEAWEEEIRAAEELGAREREAARKVGG